MLCLPPGTMRGFTVLCMQSSPYFAQGTYMYNPWGSIVCAEQSMDCLNPYFAHGTIHGLRAKSTDYCAICGSIDCAGQSTDCPNPYFAHNIYTHFRRKSPFLETCFPIRSLHQLRGMTLSNMDIGRPHFFLDR